MVKFFIVCVPFFVGFAIKFIHGYGAEGYSNSKSLGIEFVQHRKISFEIQVESECVHELGVSFYVRAGEPNQINNTFGDKVLDLNLPAIMDVRMFDESRELIFERNDFGGKGLGFRYGPNPIKFIIGSAYLFSGKYKVTIHVKSLQKNLSMFNSTFFAAHPPKMKCKKIQN